MKGHKKFFDHPSDSFEIRISEEYMVYKQMIVGVNFYHPPTELREGNVFVHVYPSVSLSVHRGGGPCMTITHDALDLTVQGPYPCPPPKKRNQAWDPLALPPPCQ